MPTIPRRVVTGHDGRGVSVFADDGPVPVVRTAPGGALFYEVLGTDAMPAAIGPAEPDPTLSPLAALTAPPPPNGTKIRINEFPPRVVSPVHRAQSVDYGIALEGEVVLVLDSEETTLRAGDVAVQRGAELVVFLLSARAFYITGAEIPVDGGHAAHGGTKSTVDALRRAGR
jgi:hypothetical protein